ncbi:hypothetical protein [Bradyrhizobium sp.]|uniref:hypothetical protein n=1 Tax=Bradyrhizobium sp. TaxID=376 RepID=UPI0027323356|nr:hypothetical protein [Bradyrhizobium sp.]MDP3077318.1 hypothetical protein [Bradyrhizobium sp.]
MSREMYPNSQAPEAQDIEGVRRRPDGSFDIAAYAKLAHRERAAAIASSAGEAMRMAREMVLGVRASLAPFARSGPASRKHHATAGR